MELYILSILFISVNCVDVDMNKVCSSQSIVNLETNKTVTDIKQVCDSKLCVIKCCDIDSFYYQNKTRGLLECAHRDDLKEIFNVSIIDYSPFNFSFYKFNASNKPVRSESKSNYTVFQNKNFLNDECKIIKKKSRLFEDGQVGYNEINNLIKWTMIPLPNYCIEKLIKKGKQILETNAITFQYVKYKLKEFPEDTTSGGIFNAVALVISAFFMILVLVVYSVLKQLRNIHGMVLMAYVATLLFVHILKAGMEFSLVSGILYDTDCKYLTPFCYGFILSSFFWLKIMSFDIWWTFRATRKIRSIHRQGELMKFMWYGVYAWGTPAAIAIFTYCIDTTDEAKLKELNVLRPQFETCFRSPTNLLYLFLPILIVTIINTLLFLMTIYNIWLIKRTMTGFEKPNMATNQNRFCLFIKLSVMMGLNWIFELIGIIYDNKLPDYGYILLNVYNVFIGVTIFFMFVCKRSIFHQLCTRFNINNSFVRSFNVTSTARNAEHSESGKSGKREVKQYHGNDWFGRH